jgi:DNA-binding transcriptional ArsR family regulator
MADAGGTVEEPRALLARDVVAFGHEVGRALSDGRIVGRAEPFAKVFPSSREVKRAVGLVAWAILEDIALDARLDDAGRLVSVTNVRRIAANLGVNKDTVAKHLARLRDHGFVLQEEGRRDDGTGRWEVCRYVLDPSACLERFTHTPTRTPNDAAGVAGALPVPLDGSALASEDGRAEPPEPAREEAVWPCPKDPDTGTHDVGRARLATVSGSTGQGGAGQGGSGQQDQRVVVQEQQPRAPARGDAREPVAALVDCGVDPVTARRLAARHGAERVRAVVGAAARGSVRDRAGWVAAALERGWQLEHGQPLTREQPDSRPGRQAAAAAEATRRRLDAAGEPSEQQRRAEGWAAWLNHELDDPALGRLVGLVMAGLPQVSARSPRVIQAHLVALAANAHTHAQAPDLPLVEAILACHTAASPIDGAERGGLPPPPARSKLHVDGADRLRRRITAKVDAHRDDS